MPLNFEHYVNFMIKYIFLLKRERSKILRYMESFGKELSKLFQYIGKYFNLNKFLSE